MARRGLASLATLALLTVGLVSQGACGDAVHRRRAIDPQRFNAADGYPGAATDPAPVLGRLPYWGQSLGATYYNWGHFGARQHPQYINHSGYYGEYIQFGVTKGY